MNKWRAIIALVVAFVLGVGAGGLVEHQRAKNDSNKKSATPTTTKQGAAAVGARWFPDPPTAACPDLEKWQAAATAAYAALIKKDSWSATQTTLETQSTAATSSLKALLPHANKVGHKGLNVLINREKKNLAAVKAAKDEAAYVTANKALSTPGVKKGNVVMSKAIKTCGGKTTSTTAKTT